MTQYQGGALHEASWPSKPKLKAEAAACDTTGAVVRAQLTWDLPAATDLLRSPGWHLVPLQCVLALHPDRWAARKYPPLCSPPFQFCCRQGELPGDVVLQMPMSGKEQALPQLREVFGAVPLQSGLCATGWFLFASNP